MSTAADLIKYEDTVLHLAWKATGGTDGWLSSRFQIVTNAEKAAKEEYVKLSNPWLTKTTAALNSKDGTAYELGVLASLFTKVLGRRDGLIQLGYGSATPTDEEKVVATGERLIAEAAKKLGVEKYGTIIAAVLVLWLLISLSRK